MSSVLLQYYQPTYPIHCSYISGQILREVRDHSYINHQLNILLVSQYYMGKFYVRLEVTHKSPLDYCVGKAVLPGVCNAHNSS